MFIQRLKLAHLISVITQITKWDFVGRATIILEQFKQPYAWEDV